MLAVVPDDGEQRRIAAEVERLCAPGGPVFLGDYPLQDSEHYRALYAASRHPVRGVFTNPDGAVFRHHDPAHVAALFPHCEVADARETETASLGGRPMRALQWVLRRT